MRRIFSSPARRYVAGLLLAAILVPLTACTGTTPPGPNAVFGGVDGQASYLLLDWQEGLRLLIWDDIVEGGHHNSGSGSTTDPVFRQSGGAEAADGRTYEYALETTDGIEAEFSIDGTAYDLEQGRLFLIRTAGDGTQVQQLDLDLAGLTPTNDGIVAFGRETPEIAAFIAENAAAATDQGAGSIGIAELDQLAAAILSNDVAARRELVQYTTAGCTTVEGLGGPPKCDPDQAEGATVEYLPVLGPGEGVPVMPGAVDETLGFPVESLYAAYRRADEPIRDVYYPPGEYGLFFATGEQEAAIQFVLVHADMAGRIVRLDYLACPVNEAGEVIDMPGLACTPEQIMARDADEVLLAPASDS
ncbi:MAG: hypothetical protein PVH18_02595 [Chloroflexota bacterium]|jgi:hypothetical protein